MRGSRQWSASRAAAFAGALGMAGLALFVWACGGDDASQPGDAGSDVTGADAPAPDAGVDVDAADAARGCDLARPFDAPVSVVELNGPGDDVGARLSADGLTVYLTSNRGTDAGSDFFTLPTMAIYRATRAASDQPFGAPAPAADLDSDAGDGYVTLTGDGLTAYFASRRAGSGAAEVFVATRAAAGDPFGAAAAIPDLVAGGANADQPYVTPARSALYFASTRGVDGGVAGFHVFRSPITAGTVGAPALVDGVYGPDAGVKVSFSPVVSADELTLYFSAPNLGNLDIWRATRASAQDAFSNPTPVTELNTADLDAPSYLTPDGCTLYFYSSRGGGFGKLDIYRASKPAK